MNGLRKRIDYLLKHNRTVQKLYKVLGSAAFRLIGAFVKTDPNLVLLSGHGRKFNDSPRVLFEAMRRDPRLKHLKYIWALDAGDATEIEGASVVISDTPAYFLTAMRANYWISCVNIERGLKFKKRRTRYLNTWHGTPLKTIGNAASGRKDFDFSNIDLYCCSGDYERQIFLRDFGVREESLLMCGLPRNDALYRADDRARAAAREKLNIPAGRKVILYAPTWRDSLDGGMSYAIRPPIDMDKWESALSDEYVLFVRAHAYTTDLLGLTYNDFVRDATDYPVLNDLLIAADILISDYSATLFDYSILGRPMLCFGYDYDEYRSARGLYLDLDQVLPGGVLRSEDDVLSAIKALDYDAACQQTRAFKDKFLTAGGNATRICIDALVEDMP